MHKQIIQLVKFGLLGIVFGLWDNFVIGIVKRLGETAEKFTHGDIHHRMAVVCGGVDKIRRTVGSNEVISTP